MTVRYIISEKEYRTKMGDAPAHKMIHMYKAGGGRVAVAFYINRSEKADCDRLFEQVGIV